MTADAAPSWHWLQSPAPHHRQYLESGAWSGRTVGDFARDRAEREPAAAAFLDSPEPATYASLVEDAEALAVALADAGLVPGDVVAFQVPNWHEAAIINLAAAFGGFVVNPIVPIYRDAEVTQMLRDCGAKVFFYADSFRGYDFSAMLARIRPSLPCLVHAFPLRAGDAWAQLLVTGRGRAGRLPRVDPRGVKMVLYTSGTTGRPKGVLHSHDTLARAVTVCARHWEIEAGDSILMPSPVTHVSGYANGLEMPFLVGTRTVLMESWNATDALRLIERHAVRGTVAATPFLQELVLQGRATNIPLPSLRFFACGGAAVPAETLRSANAWFGATVAFRVFGASEVPLVTLGYPRDADRAASTDGEVVDYQVRVVDEAGRDLPPGGEGEILARGPAMFMGYADEAQTCEAIDTDGYFRTGDLGIVTAEGALVVTGRKKDLIIRGGENISAQEIEDVLCRHPAVVEAAVVAMPHARLGEGVCACLVVAGEPPELAEIAAFVGASGLASQKRPERMEVMEMLPRTAAGKVRKDLLRRIVAEKIAIGERP